MHLLESAISMTMIAVIAFMLRTLSLQKQLLLREKTYSNLSTRLAEPGVLQAQKPRCWAYQEPNITPEVLRRTCRLM